METIVSFALFGLWSLVCVGAGAWIMHRKNNNLTPVPSFDPDRMMRWIRTGKADENEKDDPPPFDPPESPPTSNYQL